MLLEPLYEYGACERVSVQKRSSDMMQIRRLLPMKAVYLVCISALLLVCFLLWGAKSNKPITMATGERGGLYHHFGVLLKEKLKQESNIDLILISTKGSSENAARVQRGEVDFSIVQAGINSFEAMDVVTPLFIEPVFILASNNSGIQGIADLEGRAINLGMAGSGSRVTGERILEHYEIQNYESHDRYLLGVDYSKIDAVIAVGGLLNKDLKRTIKMHDLQLIPIGDAKAISLKHPHMHAFTIPRGVFSEKPVLPQKDTLSIASTAILVSKKQVNEDVVEKVLKSIYETNLRSHFPLMMTPKEVKAWTLFPLKPASLKYLDPYSGISLFSNFASSLAAIKELIFALVAMAYFAWVGFGRLNKKKEEQEYSVFKEKLDDFLIETIRLEKAFVSIDSKPALEALRSEAIAIKLRALAELTHEQLRGDGLFAIFMIQSSNLIIRIEQELLSY